MVTAKIQADIAADRIRKVCCLAAVVLGLGVCTRCTATAPVGVLLAFRDNLVLFEVALSDRKGRETDKETEPLLHDQTTCSFGCSRKGCGADFPVNRLGPCGREHGSRPHS